MTVPGTRPDGFPPTRAESRPELLAPGSPTLRVLAEPLTALYGLPGFLLPLMHPATAAATLKRDRVFADPDADVLDFARRLRDTIEMIAGVAHGGEEADHIAYAMRELHRPMRGEDTRGATYHAWTRDIWTWNWAAITAGFMRGYEVLRGWPDREFRDDAYLGLIEVGRRFGVLGMPATYDEFLVVWPAERDRVADPRNEGVRTLVGLIHARGLPAPRALRPMPLPLWALVTAPIRHFLRVAVMVGLLPEEREMIGFPERAVDRVSVRIHVVFWRLLLPRKISYRVGLAWMSARARWSTPVWRTHFSAEALAARAESA
ncbi:oxygenase MpaB family protein [Nocardioides sp. NPDC057772]|uniref:oxygenase MpaB family protein n=1 Tax=Nocardioides sp. NPDC057772 TaxID=3346245 RepID=UPI0036702700